MKTNLSILANAGADVITSEITSLVQPVVAVVLTAVGCVGLYLGAQFVVRVFVELSKK